MLVNVQVIYPAQVDDDEIRAVVQNYWKHLCSKYSRGEAEREHKRIKMANYMSNKRRAAQVVSLSVASCDELFYTYLLLRPINLKSSHERWTITQESLVRDLYTCLPFLPTISITCIFHAIVLIIFLPSTRFELPYDMQSSGQLFSNITPAITNIYGAFLSSVLQYPPLLSAPQCFSLALSCVCNAIRASFPVRITLNNPHRGRSDDPPPQSIFWNIHDIKFKSNGLARRSSNWHVSLQ
jgi:hypothetical protein